MYYGKKKGQHMINEFHIARSIREKYNLEEFLFGTDGRLVFANFRMVRELVFRVNKNREPENHIYAGEVNAAGLIDEIFHLLLREYEKEANPGFLSRLKNHLLQGSRAAEYRALLLDFVTNFPSQAVYQGKQTPGQYLMGFSAPRPHIENAIEECIMIHLANLNPANKKFREFFDINHLENPELFNDFIEATDNFLRKEPSFGPEDKDIFSLLKTPMEHAPQDLNAQLEYILKKWKNLIPETLVLKIMQGQDLMREDVRLTGGPGGPPPTMAPRYKGFGDTEGDFSMGKSGFNYARDAVHDYEEYKHFTDDTHWMPRVVMIARNTYVWLDQLSKKYDREIKRLDQVPDQELDQLARWNINGLWLIGIWERSVASRRIKHIMGNTDAVSSAYSLFDYEIAADLGGEQAYDEFNRRARQRGIRLAGDMVPNHTGIFSRWVLENPDFFIQAKHPPFPGYTFNGENLSPDDRVQIKLEDGYYNHSDASVVFQWINNHTGEVKYIYHGNDGTLMPWNDTAQLDFLKKEVREAVIQKIFDVARRFSIIRFDAAMTLAKKHFSRLWYPRPGTGGDIASRADHAMTQKAFDELFPAEFWREVVDRMNSEMPDTLLLAEAFWFMEGYFVRTLGMHRVYNSAFMHMLNNEENSKYRELIINTLEFEPEILKRYVNFMSNPDEETAIKQFGTGDKYFGICTLMTTLPGLPMFGHGQIEGYTEKYGMEYQRAYYNEAPNQWLIEKHEREIFPLMARRYVFSEVEHFNLFNFTDNHGNLNENVLAYTNRSGNEKALILYNNKYDQAFGGIYNSVPRLDNESGSTRSYTLGEALKINPVDNMFYIFREHISGMEFLRTGKEIDQKGFQWDLKGFEYRVFIDFTEKFDNTGELNSLYQKLGGLGTPSISTALAEMRLQPIHQAFENLFKDEHIRIVTDRLTHQNTTLREGPGIVAAGFEELLKTINEHHSDRISLQEALTELQQSLESVEKSMEFALSPEASGRNMAIKHQVPALEDMMVLAPGTTYRENTFILLSWLFFRSLNFNSGKQKGEQDLVEELKLSWPLQNILAKTGRGPQGIARDCMLVDLLSQTGANKVFEPGNFSQKQKNKNNAEVSSANQALLSLLESPLSAKYLAFNEYKQVVFFSKEYFNELLQWLFSLSVFEYFKDSSVKRKDSPNNTLKQQLSAALEHVHFLRMASQNAGYQIEKLKDMLKD